jgi:hypothetical protein
MSVFNDLREGKLRLLASVELAEPPNPVARAGEFLQTSLYVNTARIERQTGVRA